MSIPLVCLDVGGFAVHEVKTEGKMGSVERNLCTQRWNSVSRAAACQAPGFEELFERYSHLI
jgi:hypothetical protein